MIPAEVYDYAAKLIERDGWVRGMMGSEEFGFCLVGASLEAAKQNGHTLRCPARTQEDWTYEQLLRPILDTVVGSPTRYPQGAAAIQESLTEWNDSLGDDARGEVVDVLHRTSERIAGL